MYLFGMTANIMSISGITISIGVLVDGAIVEVENAYKKLERWIAAGGRATSTPCASRRSRRSGRRSSSRCS
jgi:Cu/Ag efflux pump CusA